MAQPVRSFPITLSDITFTQQPDREFYKTLKTLRKSTLSIPHRLRAIFSDAEFVHGLQRYLIDSDLQTRISNHCLEDESSLQHLLWPLIANERAGSWYISPSLKAGSAYFKSTDGHYGNWDLSLRRLNLPVLETLGTCRCAILVDSTRRGKDFPDALRRTVPIWIETWNRILFSESELSVEYDVFWKLQVKDLEASEVAQIEARIGGFMEKLRMLGLDVAELRRKVKKPIMCVWVNNHSDRDVVYEDVKEEIENVWQRYDCNVLVLCSASRRVIGAEMSEDGYIQGAGDDSEAWSCGLTPSLAWRYKLELLSCDEDSIEDLVQKLMRAEKSTSDHNDRILIKPTQTLFVGQYSSAGVFAEDYGLIINCNAQVTTKDPRVLDLHCRDGKIGSKDLKAALSKVKSSTKALFEKTMTKSILLTCTTGKDLSVGVAVALLCLFYNNDGQVDLSQDLTVVDKLFVKQRLAWITSSKPDANPSRSTMQAIHSFLIDRPS